MTDIFGSVGPVRTGPGSIYDYTAPSLDVLSATAEDAWAFNPVPAMIRFGRRKFAEGEGEMLNAEQARQRVKDEQLPLTIPEAGISTPALDILMETKRDELKRKQVMARSPGGIGLGAAQLGVGLAVSMADPINIASGFIPVGRALGAARALESAATPTARALARAKLGAVEGAVGATVIEPFVYGMAQSEQADYTLQDSFMNVAFGTIMGGGLHAGVGAVGDRAARRRAMSNAVTRQIENLPVEDRPEVMRALMGQVLSDRTPNGNPVVEALNIRNSARNTQSARQVAQNLGGQATARITPVDPTLAASGVVSKQLDSVRAQIDANSQSALRGDIIENIDVVADARARQRDPALFNKADDLDMRIAFDRQTLDDLRAGKEGSADLSIVRGEIAKTQEALGRTKKTNKLQRKKLQQKIDTLTARMNKIVEGDTPDQARVRKNLIRLEQQRRDLGSDISAITQKAANEIKSGKSKRMSIELAQDINTVLHEREIELETQLQDAMSREIAAGTYRPEQGKHDFGTDVGITAASRNAMDMSRRDADRANKWESATFAEPDAVREVDATVKNVKDQTPDEVQQETDDLIAILNEEQDDIQLDFSDLEEFELVDETAFNKGLEEYAVCMVKSA